MNINLEGVESFKVKTAVRNIDFDALKVKCPICGATMKITDIAPDERNSSYQEIPYQDINFSTYEAKCEEENYGEMALCCPVCHTELKVPMVDFKSYTINRKFLWNEEPSNIEARMRKERQYE